MDETQQEIKHLHDRITLLTNRVRELELASFSDGNKFLNFCYDMEKYFITKCDKDRDKLNKAAIL